MDEELKVCDVQEACKEDILLTSIYNIIFTNDLACSRIADAVYHIKQSGKYRQLIKKETNRLQQLTKEFEKMMSWIAGPRLGFMADANQVVEDECKIHIDGMRLGMKREFKKVGHSNPDMMSHIEMARTFSEMACVNLDCRIKEMLTRGVPEANRMKYMRMTDIFKAVDRLCELLYEGGNIDLNKNELCISSLRLIEVKLTDANLIAKAIVDSENINMENKVPDKDVIEIQEKISAARERIDKIFKEFEETEKQE